jgi:hypothetical protein
MIDGTNSSNFIIRRGGYNCGHQLVPVAEEAVPLEIRSKILYEQQQGIKTPPNNAGNAYFDPTGIKTFADLVGNLAKRAAPAIRKRGFENYLKNNKHSAFKYDNGNIYV